MTLSPEILDRTPPHDVSAERCALGSVLLDTASIDRMAKLRPEHFRVPQHAELYRAMLDLYDEKRTVDPVMLAQRLPLPNEGGPNPWPPLLAELALDVPYAANAAHHAETVIRLAAYRAVISVGSELIRQGYAADAPMDQVLAQAEQTLAEADGQQVVEGVLARDAAQQCLDRIDEIIRTGHSFGVPTGFSHYDEECGGLHPGELVILAARPSVGKTALACQIAWHVALGRRGVYFVTLEMAAVELMQRILCGEANVSSREIRTGQIHRESAASLVKAAAVAYDMPLRFDASPAITAREVCRRARRHRDGLTLIVVDYLQLLAPIDPKASVNHQVGASAKELKRLAVELNIPILCLSQLNRVNAQQKSKPSLHHLRESGEIEQHADTVMFLHRESDEPPKRGDTPEIKWYLEKQRNGSRPALLLKWVPEQTKFYRKGETNGSHSEFDEFSG